MQGSFLLVTFGQLIYNNIIGVDVNGFKPNNKLFVPAAMRVHTLGDIHECVSHLEQGPPHFYELKFSWLVYVKFANENSHGFALFV